MTDGYTVAYLLPRPTPQQMVERALVDVEPDVDDRDEHTDAFGNRVLQFGVHHQHDCLTRARHGRGRRRADAASTATGRRGSRSPTAVRACRGGEALLVRPFAGGLPLVEAVGDVAELRRLVTSAFAPGRPVIDAARAFCHRHLRVVRVRPRVHRRVDAARRPCSPPAAACARTSPTSPPAACGLLGLAARYVSGYIETAPARRGAAPRRRRRVARVVLGVGARQRAGSTSTRPTTTSRCDRHVTLAWGRDYNDVPPVRGVVIGPPAHQTAVASPSTVERDRDAADV